MLKSSIFISLGLVITANMAAPVVAQAQTSYEVMCRNQAKEIAAETYKSCITEQRQSQVEQIRKEYQDQLAGLKAHYDGELKKLGGGTPSKSRKPTAPAAAPVPSTQILDSDSQFKLTQKRTTGTKSANKRRSGARELPLTTKTSEPAKRVANEPSINTQSIDLSSPLTSENGDVQSQTGINSSDYNEGTEIVEIPIEQE